MMTANSPARSAAGSGISKRSRSCAIDVSRASRSLDSSTRVPKRSKSTARGGNGTYPVFFRYELCPAPVDGCRGHSPVVDVAQVFLLLVLHGLDDVDGE